MNPLKHIHGLLLLLLGSGCHSPLTATRDMPSQQADPINLASALRDKEEHLGASYYLELAIARGGDETTLLAPLIDSLIRAGRFSAARKRLERLCHIDPDNTAARDLLTLVDEAVGIGPSSERGDVQ